MIKQEARYIIGKKESYGGREVFKSHWKNKNLFIADQYVIAEIKNTPIGSEAHIFFTFVEEYYNSTYDTGSGASTRILSTHHIDGGIESMQSHPSVQKYLHELCWGHITGQGIEWRIMAIFWECFIIDPKTHWPYKESGLKEYLPSMFSHMSKNYINDQHHILLNVYREAEYDWEEYMKKIMKELHEAYE